MLRAKDVEHLSRSLEIYALAQDFRHPSGILRMDFVAAKRRLDDIERLLEEVREVRQGEDEA